MNKSMEQQARDLLEQCGVEDAQSFSAGDVVALANVLSELNDLRQHSDRQIGGQVSGIEHDYNNIFHDAVVCVIADLRRAGYAVVRVPEVAFKGPYETNGTMLIAAADRAEKCYPVGGSNLGRAVAQLLREVAAAAD